MQLKEKVIVITGAGRGFGRATALLFGREGGKIIVAARTLHEIERTAAEIIDSSGEAIAVQMDVTDRLQVRNLFQRVDNSYGRIDILVNNAGIGRFGPVEELTPEDLESMMAVNLKGTVYCSQEAFVRMKQAGGGHIINIVSTAGKVGRGNESGYSASKWAVVGFTESLKAEGKPFGIRVTSFCPGGMNTPFWDTPAARKHQPNADRFMDPHEVAAILLKIATLPQSVVIDDIVIKRM